MKLIQIKKYFAIVSVFCMMLITTSASARPVSYPGGWTVMQRNNSDRSSLHVHYSPTAKYSVGYKGAYWHEKKFQTHSLAVNNLLKRWNNLQSQANIYTKSGLGFAYDTGGDQDRSAEPHVYTGISMDWENRRFFSQFENSFHYYGDFDDEYTQSITGGIAPYIGEYGDLHTWIMLRVDHEPESDDEITVTPFLRFFKDIYLFEIGASDKGDIMANIVMRF